MELENLPEHILVKVCRYFDLKSKLNLMLTSKFFNDFIGRIPELCEFFFKFGIKDWEILSIINKLFFRQ
jgi:hypothetical protein